MTGTLTTGNFGLLDLTLNSTCWPGGTWNPCGNASMAVKDLPGMHLLDLSLHARHVDDRFGQLSDVRAVVLDRDGIGHRVGQRSRGQGDVGGNDHDSRLHVGHDGHSDDRRVGPRGLQK